MAGSRFRRLQFRPGKPFTLKVELGNTGVCPWLPTVGQYLEIAGDGEKLGLPKSLAFLKEPMVFGDTQVVELQGVAPAQPGEGELDVKLHDPFRTLVVKIETKAKLKWE